VMQMMYGALSEGRHRVLPLVRDLEQHCARHESIFQQIAQRNPAGARRAVIADLKYAESLLQQNLQEREWQGTPRVVTSQKQVTAVDSRTRSAGKLPVKKSRVGAKNPGGKHE
jgi:hypothetical protein